MGNFESDWIKELESFEHFSLYYQQIKLAMTHFSLSEPTLEIGPGTHMSCDVLRRKGFALKTLDIDAKKSPDMVGSLADFDFHSQEFTQILAFEVFEHVPLEIFSGFLDRLKKSNVARILFSVPMGRQRLARFRFESIRGLSLDLDLSFPRLRVKEISEYHHWELAARAGSLSESKVTITRKQLRSLFQLKGFNLEELGWEGDANYFLVERET